MLRILALAGLVAAAMTGTASATPLALDAGATPALIQVQLRCDQNSCINQQTGEYTQSQCDYRGCRPVGGVVGRLGPGGEDMRYGRRGYGYGGPQQGYGGPPPGYGYSEPPQPRRYGGGGFDCNSSRCIEVATGAIWESTCDRYGCRPLRPARGRRW